MGFRYQESPSKVICYLLMLDRRIFMDEAVGKLMREREPPPLQRMRLVNHNHGNFTSNIHVIYRLRLCMSSVRARESTWGSLHHAGHARYALWQRRDTHFNAVLFKQLGQIGNWVITEVPGFPDLDGEMLCIFQLGERYFGKRAVPLRAS